MPSGCRPSRRAPRAAAAASASTGSRIELDAGVRLDLGGIGKGYAVDRAAELLAQAGPCLVNAGGDVAVRGGSWPIGVDGASDARALEAARSPRQAATGATGAGPGASFTI